MADRAGRQPSLKLWLTGQSAGRGKRYELWGMGCGEKGSERRAQGKAKGMSYGVWGVGKKAQSAERRANKRGR